MPRRSRNRYPVEHAVSAGGVVYRQQDGRVEVLVCHRKEPELWCLPKGTPDPGESIAETALREVREETGIEPRIVAELGSIRYWFSRPQAGKRYDKTVHHYLMQPVGGDLSLHDAEFDSVEWMELGEARRRLTYENEVDVLERAATAIELLETRTGTA